MKDIYTDISPSDITWFLRNDLKFSIVSTCDNSTTWAMVRLSSINSDAKFEHEYPSRPNGSIAYNAGPVSEHPSWPQWQKNMDQAVARISNECKFCLYKRTTPGAKLSLVKLEAR